jgi:mercuric ion transport protein
MSEATQDPQAITLDRSRRWSLTASISSIFSAFIASACCVGPLVFALLGIGGAGLLVKFEPYRPYFIVVTFALLGTGFYFTYRKPKAAAPTTAVEGGPECACPAPRANRAGKIMLLVATVLVLAFLSFPYLAPYLFG